MVNLYAGFIAPAPAPAKQAAYRPKPLSSRTEAFLTRFRHEKINACPITEKKIALLVFREGVSRTLARSISEIGSLIGFCTVGIQPMRTDELGLVDYR